MLVVNVYLNGIHARSFYVLQLLLVNIVSFL